LTTGAFTPFPSTHMLTVLLDKTHLYRWRGNYE
jgi:hypothetical protein